MESTSGVTKCTPGYNVPGRAPQISLTRTPAAPSGITTKLSVINSTRAPAAISCSAGRQRTGRKGRRASAPTSAPGSSVLPRESKRRSCSERKMSYATRAAALPKSAAPRTINRYFKASIELPPSFHSPERRGGAVTANSAANGGPGKPCSTGIRLRAQTVARSALRSERPRELRRPARQFRPHGNPASRRRPHHREGRLQQQPMKSNRGGNGKHRCDGEYGEMQHGDHGCLPIVQHQRSHSDRQPLPICNQWSYLEWGNPQPWCVRHAVARNTRITYSGLITGK